MNKIAHSVFDAYPSTINRNCRQAALLVASFQRTVGWMLFLALSWTMPALAAGEQAQTTNNLKSAVILMGANSANDALEISVPSDKLKLDLYFQVKKLENSVQDGKLIVTNFQPQTQAAPAVVVKIGKNNGQNSNGASLLVPLKESDLLHINLTSDASLRPGTTYKGYLFLTSSGMSHRWEVTLKTGTRGVLGVDPIGVLKFETLPCVWNLEDCTNMGIFPVTLRDKSDGGPYHHVSVRFEPIGTAASKAITSVFSFNTFSFLEETANGQKPLDLEHHGQMNSGESLNIGYREQRKLTAQIKNLSPGEYSGALRFSADEASDDSPDSKLTLTIQVRHHWTLPVIVILLGSLVGWFTSKYVVAWRKARGFANQAMALRERAEYLVRHEPSRSGWEFPSEANSYGLARVRVMLSQLANLTSSAMPILLHESEIQKQISEAGWRLSALESLHETRLLVQPRADGRPAVQLALGHLLRRASNIIDQPMYTEIGQAEFAELLKTAKEWLVDDTFETKYRKSLAYRDPLVARIRQEIKKDNQVVQSLPVTDPIREQLEMLFEKLPTEELIDWQTTPRLKLLEYDQTLAKLALLWREKDSTWATELADKCAKGKSIDTLFNFVDTKLWEDLSKNISILKLKSDHQRLETHEIVEVHITSTKDRIKESRLIYHPLHVRWRIKQGNDKQVREEETDGLTLVQYFFSPGKVKIEGFLCWQNEEIALKNSEDLEVEANAEYSNRRFFCDFNEWAVLGIAAGFAGVTAMNALYDSTFGSFNQYLSLFIWAAGVGTGGNIFKQLGTTYAPGGQPDAPLSRSAPEATTIAGK